MKHLNKFIKKANKQTFVQTQHTKKTRNKERTEEIHEIELNKQ